MTGVWTCKACEERLGLDNSRTSSIKRSFKLVRS